MKTAKQKVKAKPKAVRDRDKPSKSTPAREFVERVKAEERRKHKAAFDEWVRSLKQ